MSGNNNPHESNSNSNHHQKHPVHARTRIHHQIDDTPDKKPDQVDELLTKELMQLSLEDRNNFQDEIHGVHCTAPEETPELIANSLRDMANALENTLSPEQKRAYTRAKEWTPDSYTHGDAFRLRFLRLEYFDATKAALRMAVFLDLLLDLYGPRALERPIRLSDFNKRELADFRKGRIQLLTHRDRGGTGSGRRILCIFPDTVWEAIPPLTRHKISTYLFFVAANDEDVQRKGMVFLLWFDSNLESSRQPIMKTKIGQLPCVRISGVHVCSPDTPFYRMRRAIGIMRAGAYRSRMKVHLGESVEVRYVLQGYGFPADKIPITYSGSIKTTNLKKWMKLRQLVEETNDDDGVATIDCPYNSDVLFRRGQSMASHPGNAALRRLLRSKLENRNYVGETYQKTRGFILDAIAELKQSKGHSTNNPPVRILDWDEKTGCSWKEVPGDDAGEAVYHKMRLLVKELRDSVREERERARLRKTPPPMARASDANDDDDAMGKSFAFALDSKERRSGPAATCLHVFPSKRQRLEERSGGTVENDNAALAAFSQTECFGMRFMAC